MSARNTFAATRRSHAILKKLRGGEGVTIREVSDRFGIQYPQARADLKLLEELYDLNTYRDGRIKVWEMPGAADNKKRVGIAAALELGGVALDIFKDTPYGEAIEELAADWRHRIRPAARERLQRLSSALVLRRTWAPTHEQRMLESLEIFLDAIQMRRGVIMTYERSDGGVDDYLVIPRRLIWYQDRLWLQAVHDDAQKLFDVAGVLDSQGCSRRELIEHLVERIVAGGTELLPRRKVQDREAVADKTDESADGDDNGDGDEGEAIDVYERARPIAAAQLEKWFQYGTRQEEDAYFSDAFGIYATNYEAQKSELLVRGHWANYLRRYQLHPSQKNRETDQGLHVTFHVGLCPEYKSFIMGMIPAVEVLQPLELQEELEQRVQSWTQRTRTS